MPTREPTLHYKSSRCKIVIWHFVNGHIVTDKNYKTTDQRSEEIILDSQDSDNPIIDVQYRKPLYGGAGEFRVLFAPHRGLLQKLRPGDWMAIYLSQNNGSAWSLRCLGNINRIGEITEINDKAGAPMTRHEISGFDFGKVFYTTRCYFNQYLGDYGIYSQAIFQEYLDAIPTKVNRGYLQPPYVWVELFLKVFLGKNLSKYTGSLFTPILQWMLPDKMANYLSRPQERVRFRGSDNDRAIMEALRKVGALSDDADTALGVVFDDILKRDYSVIDDSAKLNRALPADGILWQILEAHSHDNVNELYFELEDYNGATYPTIYLRTYPFTFNNFVDPTGILKIEELNRFLDLPSVMIDRSYIKSYNVGLDDSGRMNAYFTLPNTDSGLAKSYAGVLLPDKFYKRLSSDMSINRYGLRLDLGADEFVLYKGSGLANPNLLRSTNILRKHWYDNNQCFLNGQIVMMGTPEIRVGKRLVLDNKDTEHPYPQHYYIMQYVDSWSYMSTWMQTVAVGRGIFVDGNTELFAEQIGGSFGGIQSTTTVGVSR